MALSSASRVPEPMEKCAVAAASPISTTFSCDQLSQSTRGKLIQAEPRMWWALDISAWPPRSSANSRSQAAIDSSLLMSPKPNVVQVASAHSTMKVAVSASNW